MADLQLSQDQWDVIFKRIGFGVSLISYIEEVQKRFDLQRIRILPEDGLTNTALVNTWVLDGVNIGTNTDDAGRLYVNVDDDVDVNGGASAGDARIRLFKDAAKNNEVARGAAANGATITLAQQNASGISGSVKIGTIAANITSMSLLIFEDFRLRSFNLFDNTEEKDADSRDSMNASISRILFGLSTNLNRTSTALSNLILDYVRERMLGGSLDGVLVSRTTDTDSNGAVTLESFGLLSTITNRMANNTVAQSILNNISASTAASFDSTNTGLGTMVVPTLLEYCRPGFITLECVDETIGREQFSVSLNLDESDDVVSAENFLTIKATFKSHSLGISSMFLDRYFSKTGDNLNVSTAAANNATISGESQFNTSSGVLFWKVTETSAGPPKVFTLDIAKANTFLDTDLVLQKTLLAANATVTFEAMNSSGLSGTWTMGAVPVNAATGELRLNPFKIGPPADRVTLTFSRTTEGAFQRVFSDFFGDVLESAASGAETISEDFAKANGIPPLEGS